MQKINVVAFDLGNGYMKRTYDGKNVLVDPAVYAPIQEQAFDLGQWESIVQIGQTKAVTGNEAFIAKTNIKQIIGENDFRRYETPEFKELLLSTIIKDKKCDVIIDRLVLGLPVQHQKLKLNETLKKIFSNQSFENIFFNLKYYKIHIKEVVVLPQPMGTYFKEDARQSLADSYVLIIDGGFGTVDISEINKERMLSTEGTDHGLRKAYTSIREQLTIKYPGAKFLLYDVEKIIEARTLRYMGREEIVDDGLIDVVLSMQFDSMLEYIIGRYNTLAEFDCVIFTGGFAHVFQQQIEKLQKDYGNVSITTEPQIANVQGYFRFGGGR